MCGFINTSEHKGQNTYRQIQSSNSAILLKGCIYACVVYGSHNKQILFPYI
jgi:hypothetical protein